MASCRCCSTYTLPAFLWALLSSVAAVLCPTGLYFSNWLQRKTPYNTYNSLSSFRLCLNETNLITVSCDAYMSFNEIYSAEWKAITLLMGFGACCLIFAALMSLFGICVRKLFNKCITASVATLQGLGVVLFFISIVVFPAGISSDGVRHPQLCGPSAGSFTLGECTVGWAYILVMVGTGVGAVAVGLSWTPGRRREKHSDTPYVL